MKEVKTYSGFYTATIAPSATSLPVWDITNLTRRFYIKSLIWTINCNLNVAPPYKVPLERNEILFFWLAFGNPAAITFAVTGSFTPVTAPNPSLTDQRIKIYQPGQYIFDGVFSQNSIRLYQYFQNFDLVNSINVLSNVIVEIQEEEIL